MLPIFLCKTPFQIYETIFIFEWLDSTTSQRHTHVNMTPARMGTPQSEEIGKVDKNAFSAVSIHYR